MEPLIMIGVGILITFVLTISIISLCIGVVLLERTKTNAAIIAQLAVIESYLSQLSEVVDADLANTSTGLFRSADGKYVADSLEELIQKMAIGGEIDIDPNDPDLLKKFFEQLSADDDEDDDTPWKDK